MKYLVCMLALALTACATSNKEPKRIVIVKDTVETYLPKASCYFEHHLNEKAKANIVPDVVFSSVDVCKNSAELKQANEQAKAERVGRIQAFTVRFPSYKKFEQAAVRYDIQVGMPEELVLLSMNVTPQVNETKTATVTRKQLVFHNYFFVYIEKGFVVAVQRLGT